MVGGWWLVGGGWWVLVGEWLLVAWCLVGGCCGMVVVTVVGEMVVVG